MNKDEFIYRFHHFRQVEQEPDYPLPVKGRPASVLIPILQREGALDVIFTERSSHLRAHPGQISFPGGAREKHDSSAAAAALREAEEEIGLPRDAVEIIGRLPDYRTISGFVISPFIGFVSPDFDYQIDPNEVASVFTVPLAHLMDKQHHLTHFMVRHNQRFPIYFIPWQGKLIWGATAAMVRNLAHHLDHSGQLNLR
ncbi:CoA pyrophosphatase [Alteromonas halophila]|uniref:Coenzyme A pyrophosphatase n=1 Tax=Alteromonas halophila TaxID=516698 RepID=A0A918MYI4_9ALTE|nr:CoA pyrophosphatase [Alteromonas halophila]GGW88389.1 coenzyme A pyrophosphatase [Alteromonas halophila]